MVCARGKVDLERSCVDLELEELAGIAGVSTVNARAVQRGELGLKWTTADGLSAIRRYVRVWWRAAARSTFIFLRPTALHSQGNS